MSVTLHPEMQQTLEPVTFNLATAVNVCAFFKLSSRNDNMLKTFLPCMKASLRSRPLPVNL